MDLAKAVSLTNVGVHVWIPWIAISTSNLIPIVALLLLSALIGTLKNVLQIPRPPGARGCDAFGIKGPSTTYGMPSGHVATAVFGWMVIAKHYGYSPVAAGIAAGIVMTWSRCAVGCHTMLQGVAGGLIGFGWFKLFGL